MLKRGIVVLLGFGVIALPAMALPAMAQTVAPQAVATPFDADGYEVTAAVTPKECLVVSSIDLKTMLAKIKDLQSKGLIRPDVDAAHVKTHAWTTAAAFALRVEPIFVVTVFKNSPDINLCHFGQAFVGFDGKAEIGYTFTMTRAMYDKVNWEKFTPTDLPNVAQGFSVGPVTDEHMNAESKLSD